MNVPGRGLDLADAAGGGCGDGDVSGAGMDGKALLRAERVGNVAGGVAAIASEAASTRSSRMSPVVVCALSAPSTATPRRFRSPVVVSTVSVPALRSLSRTLPVEPLPERCEKFLSIRPEPSPLRKQSGRSP